jgi:hypothetical protein
MVKITTQKEADELFCEKGEWVYLIEYEDGISIEVAESYLEKWVTIQMPPPSSGGI